MDVKKLLLALREQGIGISLKGNEIQVTCFDSVKLNNVKAEITRNKGEIIKYLIECRSLNLELEPIPEIGNLSVSGYPLSSSQQRLWVLSQFSEANVAYNLSRAYAFCGKLNRSSLEYSFKTLIERHESLRTVFRQNDLGEIRQIILAADEMGFRIVYKDLRNDEKQREKLQSILREMYTEGFNLSVGSLIRVGLYQIDESQWIFTYTMHHIISDGWSMESLLSELLLFYNSHVGGSSNLLPPLRIQYKDYAVWQQDQLKTESFEIHKKYWLKQLEGELPILDIPCDKVRPSVKTYNGGSINKRINSRLSSGIRSICNQQGCTLFMGLLATVKVLLYRYTNQEDIIVGTPVAGRDHIDLDDQIGFFVNTIALRTRFDGQGSFNDLLAKVKQVTLGGYEHQMYPFERLIDELKVTRDLSRSPLFDVMVSLQNTMRRTTTTLDLADLSFTYFPENESHTSKFDLIFDFAEIDGEINVIIEYNSDIYLRENVVRLLDNFEHLAELISEHSEMPIVELDFVNDRERSLLLVEFNSTFVTLPKGETIIQLLQEAFSRKCSEVAILFKDYSLTYREIDESSNRLANYLRDKYKVRPNDSVGILIHRGPLMIVGLLGILKSGAAYVPIDPTYPLKRIIYILEDSKVSVLLTDLKNVSICDKLQWEVSSFSSYICLDADGGNDGNDIEAESKRLWNYIANKSNDDISASGWINSYTGQNFSTDEIEELGANVFDKVSQYLNRSTRVLEVGCGSGLILARIAPYVQSCVGVDISESALSLCSKRLNERHISNVELHCLSANGISALGYEFDVIIVNSVVQYFPSLGYLRNFLSNCFELLSKIGVLFLGDIRDRALRDQYYRSIVNNDDRSTEDLTEKWVDENELFIDRDFLKDYCEKQIYKTELWVSGKFGKIINELTLFRFDAIFKIDKRMGERRVEFNIVKSQDLNCEYLSYRPEDLLPVNKSSDLAYIIYTSGSTGEPKGVMIEHGNVYSFIKWCQNEFQNSKFDIVLSVTSICFDLSIFEIFYTLSIGKKLRILENALLIPDFINTPGLKLLNTVPSVVGALIRQKVNLDQIAVLNMAGEPIPLECIKGINLRLTEVRNLYGPTEDTTYSTVYKFKGNNRILIGRPISNTHVYILNARMIIQPVGVSGEIYLSGLGLARGYLNKSNLTEERFISNPFVPGKLMYKTGDLGKWTSDGNIEFMGRVDDQVKIRGYRIELGEIEKILEKYSGVNKVTVICEVSGDNDSQLIAYYTIKAIVTTGEVACEEVLTAKLRSYLEEHLPSYMVPSQFIQIEEFPLTTNGKVDKKLLSNFGVPVVSVNRKYVPPRNEVERRLVLMWQKVLAKDSIGVRDNFFELGGQSIKAFQLLSRIVSEFHVKIDPAILFNEPTIESLCEEIERSCSTNDMLFDDKRFNTEKIVI